MSRIHVHPKPAHNPCILLIHNVIIFLKVLHHDMDLSQIPEESHCIAKRSWLIENEDEWALGCLVCKAKIQEEPGSGLADTTAGGQSARSFATCSTRSDAAIQICNILRHHSLPWHTAAALELLGLPPTSKPVAKTPPKSCFLKVLNELASGVSPWSSISGIGHGNNIQHSGFCLKEACWQRGLWVAVIA